MRKTCNKCGHRKDVKLFSNDREKPDGKCTLCKKCQKLYHDKYNHKYYRKNRKRELARLKAANAKREKELLAYINKQKDKPCVDCGNKYHIWQMDFDHRDGKTKLHNVSGIQRFLSKKKILEEIKKCDLVCANCHRDRTHYRRHNKVRPHSSVGRAADL